MTIGDISTITSDHGKPQWWIRGESQLYFSSNTLSRHTFKVCSLKYSRPGHCSTGPAPFLHCCDGDGRGRLTILRRCSQRHEGTEAEEFSGWGWIIEPDISSRINVDVWIILRISRYANICLTAHLFVGPETYECNSGKIGKLLVFRCVTALTSKVRYFPLSKCQLYLTELK